MTLLREPLLQFLLLSLGVFGAHGLAGLGGAGERARIVVSGAQVEALRAAFARTWQRPPGPEETERLVEDYVRTEVLAREALVLGLERDDSVIRRHLRMKLEAIADEAARRKPTDEELQAWLAAHADDFREEARFSFRQVLLDPDKRGESLERDSRRLLEQLSVEGAGADITRLGDGVLLDQEYAAVPRSEVARVFGEAFETRLAALDTGRWLGPVASGYGIHLVYVQQRLDQRQPSLEQVRAAVAREWSAAHVQARKQELYAALRKRYVVSVDLPDPQGR